MYRGRLLLLAYSLLLPVMFLFPLFSAPGYSILRNTTSHLGAQAAPHAWIMNSVFVLLGVATILEAWQGLSGLPFHRLVVTVFGLALIFTAVFRHAPIVEGAPFSVREDALHSLFASVVGFSFTLFAMAMVFTAKSSKDRVLAVGMAVLAILLSVLIFQVESYAGIWQRLMFILAFGWLVHVFRGRLCPD